MSAEVVTSCGRRFLIVNGRRVWLSQPPATILPDLFPHGYSTPCSSRGPDHDRGSIDVLRS
jgi:hypothetical protein